MSDWYKLIDGEVVQSESMEDYYAWGKETEAKGGITKKVKHDTYGEVGVSTVFLGLDHGWVPGGEPIVFETMVFGGALDQEQDRYSSLEGAEAGHKVMCQRVQEAEKNRTELSKKLLEYVDLMRKDGLNARVKSHGSEIGIEIKENDD